MIFALLIYTFFTPIFSNQMDYYEQERIMFNVPSYDKPFNYTEITSQTIHSFPMDESFIDYMCSIADKTNKTEPTKDKRVLGNDFFIKQTPRIWRWLGWQHQIHYDEEYWFYNNTKSENTVFFLHGINGIDGLENIYLLNQLKQNASVYFSIHKPAFLLHHPYERSFSDHIDNIIQFINTFQNKEKVAFVGNSYGSIRLTTICRRIDCSRFSKIIMTDPLHINLPYSEMAKHVLYGVFLENNSSAQRAKITTVKVLNTKKQRSLLERNFNINEWSIDTPFMEKNKHNLVLVIGLKDNLISVDKESRAMTQLCQVIYTNTRHGMVLFTRFLNQIILF
jgi:hypothetical protein